MRKLDIEFIRKDVLNAVKTGEVTSDRYKKKIEYWFGNDPIQELFDKEYFIKNYKLINDNKKGYDYNFDEYQIRYFVLNVIANLTTDSSFLNKLSYLKVMKKGGIVSRLKPMKNGFSFLDPEKKLVKIELISKKLPEILRHFPQLLDFKGRERECHANSIFISPYIPDEKVDIITGYVDSIDGSYGVLHSWIETERDNKKFVIDFNLNAIFLKEDYYRIRHAEPLSRISRNKMKNFLDFAKEMSSEEQEYLGHISLKEILLFFDEITDLIKQKHLSNTLNQPGNE